MCVLNWTGTGPELELEPEPELELELDQTGSELEVGWNWTFFSMQSCHNTHTHRGETKTVSGYVGGSARDLVVSR